MTYKVSCMPLLIIAFRYEFKKVRYYTAVCNYQLLVRHRKRSRSSIFSAKPTHRVYHRPIMHQESGQLVFDERVDDERAGEAKWEGERGAMLGPVYSHP